MFITLNQAKTFVNLHVSGSVVKKSVTIYTIDVQVEDKSTQIHIEQTTGKNMYLYEPSSVSCLDTIDSIYYDIVKTLLCHKENKSLDVTFLVHQEEGEGLYYVNAEVKYPHPYVYGQSRILEKTIDPKVLSYDENNYIPTSSGWWFIVYHALQNYKYVAKRVKFGRREVVEKT